MNAAVKPDPAFSGSKYQQLLPDLLVFEDRSSKDIDSGLRSRLQALLFPSWLGSLGYCESYAYPPVQRVAFLREHTGEMRRVLFYNERKVAGFLQEIEIVGPTDPCDELAQRLMVEHQADLLTLSLQTAKTFPERAAGRRLFEVRHIADDYKIDLPATLEEYLRQLGKQTRKHLPYYVRRLEREWNDDYSVHVAKGTDISWDSFAAVLELNQLRMRAKRRASLWSARLAEHRWPLVRNSGLMVSLRYKNSIVAATLSLLHGREAYMIVIAHDPQYDRLSLGSVCLWKTIEHVIGLGHTTFHLMWGESFYKEQFGGRREPLYRVSYTSNLRVAALGHGLRLLRISEATNLWHRIQRRLTGYVNLMSAPQHYQEPSK